MKKLGILCVLALCLSLSTYAATYGGGSGTSADPYQIAAAADWQTLMATSGDWGKCFILTANIDLSGVTDTIMLVGDFDTPFNGTFDGNNHSISNPVYDADYDIDEEYMPNPMNGGLFGVVGSSGQIKNLALKNVTIRGYDSIGGLIGTHYGTITNCSVSGVIRGYSNSIGGLVGGNYGTIVTCYAAVTITADYGMYIGGLVGHNWGGTITSCYATGTVAGIDYVGGLVGRHTSGAITNCYAAAAVSGNVAIGGLVGWNIDGTVTNSYAAGGTVSGTNYLGGLVGSNETTKYSNCFWDTQTTGRTDGIGDGITTTEITGKTTVEMKTLSTFTAAGWDFVEVWGIVNGQTYPYLKPCNGINPADINFSGTVDMTDLTILAANWLQGV